MEKLAGYFSFLNNKSFTLIEEKIVSLLKSIPNLPKSFIDFLVAVAPYIAMIGGVLNIYSAISWLFLRNMFYSFVPMAVAPVMHVVLIGSLQALISGVMLISAYSVLSKRKMSGWRLLFWSANVSVIASLIQFNLFGAVISAAVCWYLLIQMRPSYK